MGTEILGNSHNGAFKKVMRNFWTKYRIFFILQYEILMVVFAFTASFYIRFDFKLPPQYLQIIYETLPALLISRMAAYYYYKLHSGSWRFASMQDLMDTVKAVLLGSVLFMFQMVFIFRFREFPRSIFILETLLNVMLIGGSKFIIRYGYEYTRKATTKISKYVLIAGAGKAGFLVLNEIRTNRSLGIHVIGFVDDDTYKKKTNIQGVPVLGSIEDIPELAKKHGIDEVIIAIPSAAYKDIVRIKKIALSAQVKTRALPSLGKLICDDAFTNQLREVACDDLLGRRVLKFSRESDYALMKEEISGKVVLVTGAGGSIGSELCRQVAQLGPRILVLYERHENSLYDIEIELKKEFPGRRIIPVIGDILDSTKLDEILKVNNVDLVYHAAAYKHVPMMEREPLEAVRNNVMGTRNVADLAVANKVDKFVLISTDKAVNPANIMGTTKRIAELVIQELNGNGTSFVTVRFGNVVGSNGSVIPLFKKQIAEGGPVTVTHPEVTRYFMAIPEAVQLVMVAGAMGRGGEIFLLDMGEPIKIVDLAKDLLKRSGLEPEKDIDIVFTGLRPGEKLYEELYWQGEGIIPTDNKKITMLKPNGIARNGIFEKVDKLDDYSSREDTKEILRLLKETVPEASIRYDEIQLKAS